MTTFARWLKQRRRELGLTQDELAALAGYSIASIRKIEAGQRTPSIEMADLLAVHLDVPKDRRAAFVVAARAGAYPTLTLDEAQPSEEQVNPPDASPLSIEASPKTPTSGLPLALTPLIGREEEV